MIMTFAISGSISRARLLELRPLAGSLNHHLDAATRDHIKSLGLNRRARGRRAGARIQRRIPVVISSRDSRSEQQHRNSTSAGRRLTSDSQRPSAADSMNENHVTKSTATTTLLHVNKQTRKSSEANLLRPILHRHRNTASKEITFGTFNARSTQNLERADAIRQLRTDKNIDVLFLTETWHETADDVSLRRLCCQRSPGTGMRSSDPRQKEGRSKLRKSRGSGNYRSNKY